MGGWYGWASMTDNDTKTHIITRDLANYREADRTCPVCCNGTSIVKRLRVNTNEGSDSITCNITIGGAYWVCEAHDTDWDHYQYSPGEGKRGAKPRETVGVTVPKRFQPDFVELPRTAMAVHKRNKDGAITPLKGNT